MTTADQQHPLHDDLTPAHPRRRWWTGSSTASSAAPRRLPSRASRGPSTTPAGCGRRATSTGRSRSSPASPRRRRNRSQARWAYAEWLDLARRRFGDSGALVYSPGTGPAAVLAPWGDGPALEVLAVLGMRWLPGKTVSRRSLRGLRPLDRGTS